MKASSDFLGRTMPLSRLSRHVITLIAVALPLQAHAEAVALTPMMKDRKVTDERIQDIFSLMSSELEFMQGVTEVIEVDPAPPSLTSSCLDSSRCLGSITRDNKADTLLTGSIESVGDRLLVDLLYYDLASNKVVRRNTFDVSAEPAEMIDGMTPMLMEILTGVSPKKEREESEMADVDFDADLSGDDLSFNEAPPTRTITPAPAPVEPTRAGSARTVDRTITAPPPPAPVEDEFDPNDFSFSSPDDISFGDSSSDITYEAPPAAAAPTPAPAPRETRRPAYDEETFDRYDPDVVEMEMAEAEDMERGRAPSSSTRSTTQRNGKATDKEWKRVHIQLKGGFTNYGVFNFGTAEVELKIRLYDGLFLSVGGGAHFVNRCVPLDPNNQFEQPAAQCGDPTLKVKTDIIFPFQFDAIYHFNAGKFQPYLGVGGQFAQIYADQTTGQTYFSGGARLRGGFDYFFTKNFGLNLDAALGFWTSEGWALVDPRNPTIGFVPHISGGVVIGF